MTEPSRALVEAAKRLLMATKAEFAAWAAYTDARREREAALRESSGGTIGETSAAYDIARTELAAESASPPTSGSSTTPADGGTK